VIWFRTRDILSVPVPVIICSKFAASVSFDDWFAGCTRTGSQASALMPGLFVLKQLRRIVDLPSRSTVCAKASQELIVIAT
jgi:hypothetical protein